MIRLLSCNLRAGRADPVALQSIIERHRIDVACAQELGDRLAKTLSCVLPEGHLAPDARRRGLGIASRRPVSVRPLPLDGRDGLVARLSPSDWPQLRGPFEIVNLHMLAPHAWPYFPRRARRTNQLAQLLEYLRANTAPPRAVVGDLNATPMWPAYKRVAAIYRDGVREVLTRPPRTWPNLSRLGLPGLLKSQIQKSHVRSISTKTGYNSMG